MPDIRPYINYNPNFFTPIDIEDAKKIILGHGIHESQNRWDVETEWTYQLFRSRNFLTKNSIVLDWGCGIGRLSKMIIERFDCTVVGVDIDKKMLEYSIDYVKKDKFIPMSVDDFKKSNRFDFTTAIAVWTLQHSVFIEEDLDIIKKSLISEGDFFIFEENQPAIPIKENEKSIWFILKDTYHDTILSKFDLIEHGRFPEELAIIENNDAWWGFLKNKTT